MDAIQALHLRVKGFFVEMRKYYVVSIETVYSIGLLLHRRITKVSSKDVCLTNREH